MKSWRLQPHYIDAGDIIQPDTEELLLSSRKVHPPVVRFGRKQDSLIVLRVFRVWADSNLNVPRRAATLTPKRWEGWWLKCYDFRGKSYMYDP